MARQARNSKIDSRSARAKLPEAHEPFWHKAGHAVHLGYRKGTKGASWVARGYDGARYFKVALGTPDDLHDADGAKVLSFTQAVEAALSWWAHRLDEHPAPSAPVTVREAATPYLEKYVISGGKDLRAVEGRLRLHILPAFGDVEINKLTTAMIEKWFFALATTSRLYKKATIGSSARPGELDLNDADAVRRRRSSANRTLTVLRAVLNHAFRTNTCLPTDKAWRAVQPFGKVDAARERSLSRAEVDALLAVTTGPFRDLLMAAYFTGCRYGELAAMTIGNVDMQQKTTRVTQSKSGEPRDVHLTPAAVKLFSRLCEGRKPKDPLLVRPDGERWKAADQLRPMRAACIAAKIDPPVGFHILRHTHASDLVMGGVSLEVVAEQIGHRDIKTTKKFYAHLRPSYVAAQISAALPSFSTDRD